jgi:hypothetical protein
MTPPLVPKLGCATQYTALIYYWDRALGALRYYTELTGITEINWERTLDDFSEARLRFRPRKGDDCCGKIRPIFDSLHRLLEPGIWPWAHELALFRDGELVWQGPVFSIDELVLPDESTDHIQITARDFLAWLDRRTVHEDIFLNDTDYDLSAIAEAIIVDAFTPDDPGVLEHLVIQPSGRTGRHTVRHWEARCGDELRTVARGGLDFTAVGRAIIVKGPTHDPAIPTTVLRARDFLSGIEIRVVGAEAATAGIAVGGVPTPEDIDPENPTPIENVPPLKVYEGGLDPFFGLIENWTQSEGVQNESLLGWIARQKILDGFPPPQTLSVPAESGLNPEAPVSIHNLVPGTFFTILVQGTCRELSQYMRLSHLRVAWVAGAAESIGVTFIPANIVDDAPEEP